jgi:hypothetical protein
LQVKTVFNGLNEKGTQCAQQRLLWWLCGTNGVAASASWRLIGYYSAN